MGSNLVLSPTVLPPELLLLPFLASLVWKFWPLPLYIGQLRCRAICEGTYASEGIFTVEPEETCREGSAVFRLGVKRGWVNNENRQRNAPLLVAERAHERDAISRDR